MQLVVQRIVFPEAIDALFEVCTSPETILEFRSGGNIYPNYLWCPGRISWYIVGLLFLVYRKNNVLQHLELKESEKYCKFVAVE